MILEAAGKWAAGKLLNAVWDKAKESGKQPEVLISFEAACIEAAKEYPDLFSTYTGDALAVSPEGEDLAERLQETFGTRDFPRPKELAVMLMESWRKRKAVLNPAEAAPLFQHSEAEVQPFIGRLSELFFRELANHDRLRNPFIVSVLQEMLDAFLQTGGTRKGGLALWSVNGMGMNVVRGVEDNSQPNGDFRCYAVFQLLPGNRPIDLFQFEGTYYANGCPCLNSEPALTIGESAVDLLSDWKSLKQPLRLPAAGAALRYSRHLRPPLQKDVPEDCDYGDIVIRISYREDHAPEITTEERVYRYLPGGVLEPVPAVRAVPRLNDEELKQCLENKILDQAGYDRLMAIHPIDRYMGARSDVGENFVRNPWELKLLRSLLRSGCAAAS